MKGSAPLKLLPFVIYPHLFLSVAFPRAHTHNSHPLSCLSLVVTLGLAPRIHLSPLGTFFLRLPQVSYYHHSLSVLLQSLTPSPSTLFFTVILDRSFYVLSSRARFPVRHRHSRAFFYVPSPPGTTFLYVVTPFGHTPTTVTLSVASPTSSPEGPPFSPLDIKGHAFDL